MSVEEKEYDFVIIGSGLGGLECAYILAEEGYSVVVLEKNHQIPFTPKTIPSSAKYLPQLEKNTFKNDFQYFQLIHSFNL